MRNRNLSRLSLSLLCLTWLLSACEGPTPVMPEQTWEGTSIDVETRPPRLEKGMNEFLIIASKDVKGRSIPVHDLIISLAINDTGQWQQAIQDGHVGAYRRAMRVTDPATDVLLVRIEQGNRSGILRFPLNEQHLPSQSQ
jgi:hypothetical protein